MAVGIGEARNCSEVSGDRWMMSHPKKSFWGPSEEMMLIQGSVTLRRLPRTRPCWTVLVH